MGVVSNKISKDDLRPGDHIYCWRTAYLYSHHGIYIGDGMVIHYTVRAGPSTGSSFLSSSAPNTTTQCPVCGYGSNSEGVIKSCLDCFLSGDDLYRFRYSVSFFHYWLVRPLAPTFPAPGSDTCSPNACDPPHIVLRRANYFLNNGFGTYDLFHNNCVDFATYCKTGVK